MAKKLKKVRTEADCPKSDANDPVLKMLDDENMSIQEIFDALGWDPISAKLFEADQK